MKAVGVDGCKGGGRFGLVAGAVLPVHLSCIVPVEKVCHAIPHEVNEEKCRRKLDRNESQG